MMNIQENNPREMEYETNGLDQGTSQENDRDQDNVSDDTQDYCRFCRTSVTSFDNVTGVGKNQDNGIVIAPCECRGSMAYVCVSCLTGWIQSSHNFECGACKLFYKIPNILNPHKMTPFLKYVGVPIYHLATNPYYSWSLPQLFTLCMMMYHGICGFCGNDYILYHGTMVFLLLTTLSYGSIRTQIGMGYIHRIKAVMEESIKDLSFVIMSSIRQYICVYLFYNLMSRTFSDEYIMLYTQQYTQQYTQHIHTLCFWIVLYLYNRRINANQFIIPPPTLYNNGFEIIDDDNYNISDFLQDYGNNNNMVNRGQIPRRHMNVPHAGGWFGNLHVLD